jgi:hypothetical protein
MSHIEACTTKVRNLKALEAAAKDLGAVFAKESNYRWYGRSEGDYSLPPGIKKEDLGKCDYTITVPGITYQVGVVIMPDGHYELLYDFWGNGTHVRSPGGYHDGEKLRAHFGAGVKKLGDYYEHHVLRLGCLPGQQCLKVDSEKAAQKASLITGHKIQYQGKLRTIITT